MSAKARVLRILRDGEQSSVAIAKRWPWWCPWSMYPALMRLEGEGAITSRWREWSLPQPMRLRLYRLAVVAPMERGNAFDERP